MGLNPKILSKELEILNDFISLYANSKNNSDKSDIEVELDQLTIYPFTLSSTDLMNTLNEHQESPFILRQSKTPNPEMKRTFVIVFKTTEQLNEKDITQLAEVRLGISKEDKLVKLTCPDKNKIEPIEKNLRDYLTRWVEQFGENKTQYNKNSFFQQPKPKVPEKGVYDATFKK